MTRTILHFLRAETGATAIEYGLIATGISIAIITAVASLGSSPQHHVHERADFS